MTSSLIFCTTDPSAWTYLVRPFAEAGLNLTFQAPPAALALQEPPLGIFLDGEQGLTICPQLRQSLGQAFVPILLLTGQEPAGLRRRALHMGADLVLDRHADPLDLLAQFQALLKQKERFDQLSERAAEVTRVNTRLQTAYQQINYELDLARRIQESFLPQTMPTNPKARFAVEYRPCGQVGGDFYDVFRLDENNYGFYIADAMGHGVGASLLTIFVKKSVQTKDIDGQNYRLVPPDEVLKRLNQDFIDQALSDTPFITMIYGLFNFRTGILQLSRAGHPYPLYVPNEGPVQSWQMEGSLLGVFATQYRLRSHPVLPGDKVLFFTDAMDGAKFADHPVGTPSLLAAIEAFRHLPVEQLVQRLASDLFSMTKQSDDLTVFGLEVPRASAPA